MADKDPKAAVDGFVQNTGTATRYVQSVEGPKNIPGRATVPVKMRQGEIDGMKDGPEGLKFTKTKPKPLDEPEEPEASEGEGDKA